MDPNSLSSYQYIRDGGAGFHKQKRGLVAVWGREAVQFLDGLITNDMKTLEDGAQMLAAFPNAQGRLLAVVRVMRQGDRFLFETEEATREKVFQNLFRFTFAGDFFVEDLSDQYVYLDYFGTADNFPRYEGSVAALRGRSGFLTFCIPLVDEAEFRDSEKASPSVEISDEVYEVLRIESGTPKFGIDMDENTIVPEIGLDDMISYKKGCYIGQEIIARIHFRGHVAKRLTGIVLSEAADAGAELQIIDGKNAGRITSVTRSPKLETNVALAYVRYEHLAVGTELNVNGIAAIVTDLPFIN